MSRYICKNKWDQSSERDWICFCPESFVKKLTAKQVLNTVCNNWLSEIDIKYAKQVAKDSSALEDDALTVIAKLEDHANGAYEMWRNCQ
jgi:hypothetical protein